MADRSAALAAVSEALLGIAGDLRSDAVLERLVEAARGLGGATYAALGVPDEEGDGFSRWISAGLTDAEIDAIGPLPRDHGLLGAALHDPQPFRSADVLSDARFGGWWPSAHPDLEAFLAVPIVFRGQVVGAFYLANKDGGFTEDDQRLVRDLADHAAVLIEHSRLYEARRELSVLEERNRLARELHDALTQSLFGLRLRLEADDVDGARSLLEDIFGELRSLILQLRPPDLERDGLVASLAKHLDVVGRTHGIATRLDAGSLGQVEPDTEQALFRIAQEAVTNVVKHARAGSVTVHLQRDDGTISLEVDDDGHGFDPSDRAISSRRLGLLSMQERAVDLGGSLVVESGVGSGTSVRAKVPA
ncbi:MAG: GAF domain-containing sensor histidine kinase [Acidimicrobiales bacterium]